MTWEVAGNRLRSNQSSANNLISMQCSNFLKSNLVPLLCSSQTKWVTREQNQADIRTSDKEGLYNPEDGLHGGHPRHHRDHVRHHLHQAQPGGRQDAHLSSKADRQQHEGQLSILSSLLIFKCFLASLHFLFFWQKEVILKEFHRKDYSSQLALKTFFNIP